MMLVNKLSQTFNYCTFTYTWFSNQDWIVLLSTTQDFYNALNLIDMASQLMSGMAIVIICGLSYATLMTLYIVPVLYDILFKKPPDVYKRQAQNQGMRLLFR